MMAWTILPPRWFVRPRLALAGAAAAVLLLAAGNDRRVARAADQAGAVVIAQATDPDPERRERAGAEALAAARARPEVAGARLVPPEDLLDWARQAGIATVPDRRAVPPTIEVRLARAADRAAIAARLRAIPGIAVAATGGTDAPITRRWLLEGLASATLLALAAGAERRTLGSAMRVLYQLGATPAQRIAALLLAVAGSVGAGALAGGVSSHAGSWTALLWTVPVTMALPIALLLPALRIAPARRP